MSELKSRAWTEEQEEEDEDVTDIMTSMTRRKREVDLSRLLQQALSWSERGGLVTIHLSFGRDRSDTASRVGP